MTAGGLAWESPDVQKFVKALPPNIQLRPFVELSSLARANLRECFLDALPYNLTAVVRSVVSLALSLSRHSSELSLTHSCLNRINRSAIGANSFEDG